MAANDYSRTVNITPLGTAYAWDTPPSWITITRVGTTDEWTITVSPNTGSARTAVLTVRHDNGSTTDTINVSQAGAGPTPTPTSGSGAGPTPTPTSGSGAGPTPTPTSGSGAGPTPTPTATQRVFAYSLTYDQTSAYAACYTSASQSTVYSADSLALGTPVYGDQNQSTSPASGYYSDGSTYYHIVNGFIDSTDLCSITIGGGGGGGGGSTII